MTTPGSAFESLRLVLLQYQCPVLWFHRCISMDLWALWPQVGFWYPWLLMALATIIFFSGRKKYVKVPPQALIAIPGIIPVCINFIRSTQTWAIYAWCCKALWPWTRWRVKAVYRVMSVFFFALAFWLWDQCLSEWTLYAERMDSCINLGLPRSRCCWVSYQLLIRCSFFYSFHFQLCGISMAWQMV